MDWSWRRTGLPPHCSCAVLIFAVLLSWSSLLDLRCEAEQKLAEDEVKALKIIGSKLRKKWDFSVDPCSGSNGWIVPSPTNSIANNVTCACNLTTNICHVTSILLKSQNLTGELPEEFADLPFLTDIDLTYNYLNGTIPPAWAKLPLTHLSILGNRVTGTIPKELGDMITLEDLVLEDNQLQGSIPASFGKLSNLRRILVTGNNLSGELPETLGNLKNLTFLLLNGNPISGQIPSFIGNWTKLQRLYLEGTAMEGPFPDSFSKLENITHLMVSNLKGGLGAFPPLQNLKNLQRLTLRNLSIPGQLPDYIGQMGNLKILDLSFNKLTGPIPLSYEALKQSLNYMYLTSNMLNGTIPDWITTSTQSFDVSYNYFTGLSVLPSCKLDKVNLVSSYASTQSNISMKSCIRRNLPCDRKATNYKLFINCGGNKVTIDDDEYEDDSEALGASVYSASGIGNWAYSSTGDFVDNTNPYIATTSKSLNITNPELYMSARLTPISLKYYGLCMMEGSYNVKLHFAEIMFTDDQAYTSNGRRLFDVSIQGQNVLHDFDISQEANGTGKAVVKEFDAWVDGNGTLEIHFYWAGKGTVSIPVRGVYGPLVSAISVNPNFKVDMGDKKLSVEAIVGIVAAGFTMVLLIMALVFLFYRKKRSELDGIELQAGQFTLKQIRAATRNFDNINKIGEGGFGPVFKGTLPDGSEIAVKQLSSKSKQGNREFLNEIGVISAVQHPNLVKLFGCCIEGDQLLLVYEYMENNSLARALFGPERYRLHLDWEKRCAIALGIARGLAYLHEESRLKIVHRDIKATNILLDKKCCAKISDFGLAKLDEEENTHISTRIAGTIGYMAPEYAMRGYLTEKADVYSFGIVVLELVSGMSNTNFRPKEEFVYLLDWACVLHDKGNLLELVDPKLGSNYSKEEALLMLKMALSCTNISPTLRPSMTTVVSMLEGKTTLDVLPARRAASVPGPGPVHGHELDELRFKAFENLSHDSQPESSITDGPWTNSSVSGQTTKEDSTLF